MLESAWLFVGLAALVWTIFVVVGAVYASRDVSESQTGDSLATVGGVVGFLLWGMWTYGSLDVEVVTDSGVEAVAHPELALLGVALALVPGYIALTGPIEMINRYRDVRTDEL